MNIFFGVSYSAFDMGYSTDTGSTGPLTTATLTRLLEPPADPIHAVIDTDTASEIDDYFALVYALLADEIDVEAIYAAPFRNSPSDNPADGMQASYEAVLEVLNLLEHPRPEKIAHRGASWFMSSNSDVPTSPAVEDLVKRASKNSEGPLYTISIGTPTNIASAVSKTPEIIEDIVVVWLGGHPHSWHTAWEFNLFQDVTAAQTLFDSGVPLVQIPCKNVAEHMRITEAELDHHLRNEGPIAEYLLDLFGQYDPTELEYEEAPENVWSKELWDITPIAYVINPEWVPTHLVHSPELSNECKYSRDTSRHLMRLGQDAHRDFIFNDFFDTILQL